MSGGRHQWMKVRGAWAALSGVGRVAAALAILAVVVLSISVASLVPSLVARAVSASNSGASDEKQSADKFARSFERSLAQVNGRSMFFDPPAPRKEPIKATASDPNAKPAIPTRYGGPTLIGFANDAAWFADGKKLHVDEANESKLKVKKLTPPWNATVEWEGAEFTIGLFDHDRVVIPTANKDDPTPIMPTESARVDIKSDTKSVPKPDSRPDAKSDLKPPLPGDGKEPDRPPPNSPKPPEAPPAQPPSTGEPPAPRRG